MGGISGKTKVYVLYVVTVLGFKNFIDEKSAITVNPKNSSSFNVVTASNVVRRLDPPALALQYASDVDSANEL